MAANVGSISLQSPRASSGSWFSALVGRKDRQAVSERLSLYVAPAVEEEPTGLPEVEWTRIHNACAKGAISLTERLNGEPEDEAQQARPQPRVIKGEALMAKLLEMRLRDRNRL
jgi:hypothetical protein